MMSMMHSQINWGISDAITERTFLEIQEHCEFYVFFREQGH